MTDDAQTIMAAQVDAIEEAYEFMLAYAAQGREKDDEADDQADIRKYLCQADQALSELRDAADACAQATDRAGDAMTAYLDIVENDSRQARAAIGLVLAQPAVSSEIVDNLNAFIHLRALLTDMFLLDSTLKSPLSD